MIGEPAEEEIGKAHARWPVVSEFRYEVHILASRQHCPRGSENCGVPSILTEESAAGGSHPKTERPL